MTQVALVSILSALALFSPAIATELTPEPAAELTDDLGAEIKPVRCGANVLEETAIEEVCVETALSYGQTLKFLFVANVRDVGLHYFIHQATRLPGRSEGGELLEEWSGVAVERHEQKPGVRVAQHKVFQVYLDPKTEKVVRIKAARSIGKNIDARNFSDTR